MAPLSWAQVARSAKVQMARPTGYLGIGIAQVTEMRAKQLRLPKPVGVEITALESGSPADRAGLAIADVVTQYNGMPIASAVQFAQFVRDTGVGESVTLEIFRGGAARNVKVEIGVRNGNPFEGGAPAEAIPDVPRSLMTWRSPMLGVEAESLNGQFAEFFGVRQGVLVRSVAAKSAGEQAGLKAGDVIQQVDGNPVTTPGDITSRLRGLTTNGTTLRIVRNHVELNILVQF